MPGEFEFLEWVRAQQKPTALTLLPACDDLAVLKWPADDLLFVGVDQMLDGVHFDSTRHTPQDIGRKAMNRNLSDCAAMGCLPTAAVVTIAAHRGSGAPFLKDLYRGMQAAAGVYNCEIVGGDTGSWDGKLVITVTILGRSDGVLPISRSKARGGDGIYVTGPLGGSILGRHMTFKPRVAEGRQIAAGGATAMIDLSDGISRDLQHLCRQSGVGAILDASLIPIHADAHMLTTRDQMPPLEHALHDGEDYELLYTCPRDVTNLPGTLIGTITEKQGVFLARPGSIELLIPRGWEHAL